MTKPVSLEEYGEAADRRIRELADQPMDLSGLENAPHLAGTLHSAAPGDSISSIMGSSDPGAIGAFMQANDLNDTSIRAGQSYLVPERDSFTASGARALGQQGLNTDNALATQQAQDRLDRSMATIGNTMSGFDPLKGLLATKPGPAPQHGASIGWKSASAEKYDRARSSADIAGKVLDAFDLQNAALGLLDGGRAAAKMGKVTGPLGIGLNFLENGLEGWSEYESGAQAAPVVAGVVGKTGLTGLAGAASGAAAGGLVGLTPAAPLAPFFAAGGAIAGAMGADFGLDGISNESVGNGMRRGGESFGRYPYYDGGVGWPVFPKR
jgi:hypothetical protein